MPESPEILIHLEKNGAALCGGLQATLLDPKPENVTCLVCEGMWRAQSFVVATVTNFSSALQQKLALLQRAPEAQAFGTLARLFIRADREVRARGEQGGSSRRR